MTYEGGTRYLELCYVDIPKTYDSKEEAGVMINAFHRHVETIIQGKDLKEVFIQEQHQIMVQVKYIIFECQGYKKQIIWRKEMVLFLLEKERWDKILENHIMMGTTCLLLREPPMDGMIVSQHVAETTLRKAMNLRLFLKLMHSRDDENNNSVKGSSKAIDLAEMAGNFLGTLKTFIYKTYKQWS